MSPISRISPKSVGAEGQKGYAGDTGDTGDPFSNPRPHKSGEADDLPDVPAGEEVVLS
jgi:hypothetical protein